MGRGRMLNNAEKVYQQQQSTQPLLEQQRGAVSGSEPLADDYCHTRKQVLSIRVQDWRAWGAQPQPP